MRERLKLWSSKFRQNGLVYSNPILWIIAVVVLFIMSPDISQFVQEEGMPSAPEGYPSQVVDEMIERDDGFTGHEILIVYQNEDEAPLAEEEKDAIKERATSIRHQSDLKLHDVMSPFDGAEAEARLLSDDEDVLVVVLQSNIESQAYPGIRDLIDEEMTVEGLNHYQTGELVINQDVLITTEEGLDRSTIITVILVFVVLAAVFKSPIAPFIPLSILATVYVISVSLVSVMIDRYGFPVSQFTEVFILIVVFGVGTDYCILIMQRFQEEAINEPNDRIAMKRTMKGARNSVLYSAMTGFIGFAAIGLANFNLYRSAVGVTFSVIFVIVALWMLFPFVFQVFGNKIFWPSQTKVKEPDNKIWGQLGHFALHKQKYAIIVILVTTIPLMFLYDNSRSFDNLDEIDPSYPSVKGYNLVEEAFGQGDLFFTTLVIESETETWFDVQALPYLELLSMNLEKIETVDEVRTLSRPEGEVLEETTIAFLADELKAGIEEAIDGLDELNEGQRVLISELEGQDSTIDQAEDGILELQKGMAEVRLGLDEVNQGLDDIYQGLGEGVEGLEEISAGQEGMLTELNALTELPIDLESQWQQFFSEIDDYIADIALLIDALVWLNNSANELSDHPLVIDNLLESLENETMNLLDALNNVETLLTYTDELSDNIEEIIERLESLDETLGEYQDQLEDLPNGLDEQVEDLDWLLIDRMDNDLNDIDELNHSLTEWRAELSTGIERLEFYQSTFNSITTEMDEQLPDLVTAVEEGIDLFQSIEVLGESGSREEVAIRLQESIDELTLLKSTLVEVRDREDQVLNLFDQMNKAVNEFQSGLKEMNRGTNQVISGLEEARTGIIDLINGLNELDAGLREMEEGVQDFHNQFDRVEDMLESLIDGIREMEEGTLEISKGLDQAVELLEEISEQSNHPLGGIVFMRDLLETDEFEQVWEQYATPNKHRIAFLEIGLTVNPYSDEAFNTLDQIEEMTDFTLQGTFLEDTDRAFEGITSHNRDLRDVSDSDFTYTASVMLIGIFIALTILFKSLVMPVYVIGSLIITYICAMSMTELIFVNLLDYDGLMWATPFFAFVLLMALGVDYSIFLLGRLSDDLNGHQDLDELILITMRKVGSTVLSAGVILGGTFASLYPSGVLTLMQVSTIVIAGIVLYTLIMLPLFIPIMFKLIGNYNWWPFKKMER